MPSPLERAATDVSSFSTDTSASSEQRAGNEGTDSFVGTRRKVMSSVL